MRWDGRGMDEDDALELAAHLDVLADGIREVSRYGYAWGFNWYQEQDGPGQEPECQAHQLHQWAEKLREYAARLKQEREAAPELDGDLLSKLRARLGRR